MAKKEKVWYEVAGYKIYRDGYQIVIADGSDNYSDRIYLTPEEAREFVNDIIEVTEKIEEDLLAQKEMEDCARRVTNGYLEDLNK